MRSLAPSVLLLSPSTTSPTTFPRIPFRSMLSMSSSLEEPDDVHAMVSMFFRDLLNRRKRSMREDAILITCTEVFFSAPVEEMKG